jgi:hypothetical protein
MKLSTPIASERFASRSLVICGIHAMAVAVIQIPRTGNPWKAHLFPEELRQAQEYGGGERGGQ